MQLPTPDIDLSLAEYATVLALILDIPVSSMHDKVDKRGRKVNPSNVIESLHVLFTLYSEFKNSAHFKAIDRGLIPMQ
jgi:intraflagellar transport protein 46